MRFRDYTLLNVEGSTQNKAKGKQIRNTTVTQSTTWKIQVTNSHDCPKKLTNEEPGGLQTWHRAQMFPSL